MSEKGRNVRNAWIVHGVALVLWVALYFYLFGEDLFSEKKAVFDLEGFGAAILAEVLACYVIVSSLVMLFVGRRPLVPLVIHGLAFAAWFAGMIVDAQEKREWDAALRHL